MYGRLLHGLLMETSRKEDYMKMKCLLKPRSVDCTLEFDYIKHTYQDACCLYSISDNDYDVTSALCESSLFQDFREFMFSDYDHENGIHSDREKKHNEYLNRILNYIERNDDTQFEVKRTL